MPTMEMTKTVRRRAAAVRAPRRAAVAAADTEGKVYCPICKVWHNPEPNAEIRQRIEDAIAGRNVVGPFASAREAFDHLIATMYDEDDDD